MIIYLVAESHFQSVEGKITINIKFQIHFARVLSISLFREPLFLLLTTYIVSFLFHEFHIYLYYFLCFYFINLCSYPLYLTLSSHKLDN